MCLIDDSSHSFEREYDSLLVISAAFTDDRVDEKMKEKTLELVSLSDITVTVSVKCELLPVEKNDALQIVEARVFNKHKCSRSTYPFAKSRSDRNLLALAPTSSPLKPVEAFMLRS